MNPAMTEYWSILRRRWRWLAWGVLLGLSAATALLILNPPLYRSEATVFVRTPGDVSTVVDGGDSYAQGRARTYAALAGNPAITARVASDLGLEIEPDRLSRRVHASNRPGTALIDVVVSAPSPSEAERTATVLLDEFAATVRTLEAVPGSLVPRAELIVVNPPGRPIRVVAWGSPVAVVLVAAAGGGLVLGALGAVLAAVFRPPRHSRFPGSRELSEVEPSEGPN